MGLENKSSHHPVVQEFLQTDKDFPLIIRSTPEPRSPILRTMALLCDGLEGKGAEAAIALAATHEKGEDPNLYLMFLHLWAEVAIVAGRLEEATGIAHRAASLLRHETPPEIHALVLGIESQIASVRWDLARREAIHRKVLSLLPRSSPRRAIMVLIHALFLARLGRLRECEEDLRWLEENPSTRVPKTRPALARFINDVETGNVEEAEQSLPAAESDAMAQGRTTRTRRIILDLMRGRLQGDLPRAPVEGDPASTLSPEGVVVVDRLLLERRVEEALAWARFDYSRQRTLAYGITFTSYNLVRAELAAGNGEAARRLLEQRSQDGYVHYLDDFFHARVDLLAGNLDSAARRFARVERSAADYRARGRLEFELRMAWEMNAEKTYRLARAAERIPPIGTPGPPPAAAPRIEPRGIDRITGISPASVAIRDAILRFAPLDVAVLVTGETGAGKEVVARALHEAGPRSREPFLAVNCGAIADPLLESELFGHEQGAFTGAERAHRGLFEEAGRGTLLLDEIGEISPRLQVSLLRVLETGEIRPVGSSRPRKIACRIAAATNAPLARRAAEGLFRKDLFFRLRRLEITVPPLRDRPEDLLSLAGTFLDVGRPAGVRAVMSGDLKGALRRYSWPGNVRELKNSIERMRVLNSDRIQYGLENLDPEIRESLRPGPAPSPPEAARERRVFTAETLQGPAPAPPLPAAEDALWKIDRIVEESRSGLRRRDRLKERFLRLRKMTRKEAARILGVSLPTAAKDLEALLAEGFLERIAPTPAPRTHFFTVRAGAGDQPET